VNSWYRWFLGQDFFDTLKNYGRLPLEMNVDKLMTTMKDREEVAKDRDDLIKDSGLRMQAELKQSLEERDLKLLDALTDAIKDKGSKEKIDLLCKIIDTLQNKNKQKRDVALQMIMDNFKVSEEQ